MINLKNIIDSKMKYAQKDDFYEHIPTPILVTSPEFEISIGSDIYLLINNKLDLKLLTIIEFISVDNYFRTSKAEFDSLGDAKHQFFSDNLKIITTNYGLTFFPYSLEFIKIVPYKKQK